MKNRKLWRVVLGTAAAVFFGVCVFSGYEAIRAWRTNKAMQAVVSGDAKALARFKPMLDDYNSWIRSDACVALGRIGPIAKDATPELLGALNDSTPHVRSQAAWALGRIGAGDRAIPALTAALDDEDSEVRRYAAFALMLHGSRAEPAVAKLIERLQGQDMGASMAACALGEIGPPAKAAIPHLIAALKKQTGLLRLDYVIALGKFGPDAKAAVPDLLPLTRDADPEVSKAAIAAVKKIDPNAKLP